MSIILAVAAFFGTLVICFFMIYAGMMRTTGATQQDSSNVKIVFWIGMALTALVVGSHWIGW